MNNNALKKYTKKTNSKTNVIDKIGDINNIDTAKVTLKHLSKKPNYSSKTRIFAKDVYMYYNGKRGTFQDGGQIDKFNLVKRISNYWLLSKKLELLRNDECLEKKTFNGESGYTIRNIINLEKKFGSRSKYGAIYLTSVFAYDNKFPIASKIMKYNYSNINEVNIMINITKELILKGLSKHFLMIYRYCYCSKIIDDRLKLISINELADGDLKMLVSNRKVIKDDELMLNILFQTFISIATFHNIAGYVHRDTHYGNFLYQQNNEIGYYHYTFNGKDYYLKSCKYNIMIYDYGFAKEINNEVDDKEYLKKQDYYIYIDYYKILHAFINKKKGGWITCANLPNITEIILSISAMLYKNIYTELYSKNNKYDKLPYSNRFFSNIVNNIFLKYGPVDMFITRRPPNIINKNPFIIG